VIYQANFLDLLRLYNVDVDDKQKYEYVAEPHLTQLISDNNNGHGGSLSAIPAACAQLSTSLIPEVDVMKAPQFSGGEDHKPSIIYGHLGLADFTMYPMIRPGALLKIDTSQNKPISLSWRNEYERPVFFIELREAYACGWCELQGNQLLIIPHHSSPASVRRFMYPREAEIVGRVIGYSTHCIDRESQLPQIAKKPKSRDAKSISN